MKTFIYQGSKTQQIRFPLGGIGSGCISLRGNGNLVDWEIFNRPSKMSLYGFSHFAVKAEAAGKVLDARVLHGDLPHPYMGDIPQKSNFNGYGFGPDREYLTGLPHFESVKFQGEFPMANLFFQDPTFPGNIKMEAFNPFIPLNDKDSSIPGAFFEIEITNPTQSTLDYTVAFSSKNPFGVEESVNHYHQKGAVHCLNFASYLKQESDLEFGNLSIATDAATVNYQEYWYRGAWFDNVAVYWKDFVGAGPFKNRRYEGKTKKLRLQTADHGTLSARLTCEPGKTVSVKFVLTWHFPNFSKSWEQQAETKGESACGTKATCCGTYWKNYYASLFKDSQESAFYSLKNWDRLYQETLLFKNSLFSSSLPPVAIEAISANLSTLKTPTCLRLEDGSFYAFEGCHGNEGCCEGSCTHVWNYVYTLPFLFPQLAKSMRDLEYRYNLNEHGEMTFRLMLPLGSARSGFRACVDGTYGTVLNTFREWKISGDTQWLQEKWPLILKVMEFAWSPENPNRWDPNKTGIIDGCQHHTLDMELFGPNSWLTGFYLAALKACTVMAKALRDSQKADEFLEMFTQGKRWVDENLFNGQYYYQKLDLQDHSVLAPYKDEIALNGADMYEAYWSEEHQEIKYQIGEGCHIDQVVAQWHANLLGLGEIFDPSQTQMALKSVFENNFKTSMRHHVNPCRIYALNDEAGEVMCEWPDKSQKPAIAVVYAEETMHGFEYASASHMIQEGMVEEGLKIIKAVRDKYDGEKRNPWNEIECGSHYARSMASYAFLLSWSGYHFDMANHEIGFNPIQYNENESFRYFWSIASGWGRIHIDPNRIRLSVLYGALSIETFVLPFLSEKTIQHIGVEQTPLKGNNLLGTIRFDSLLTIEVGQTLEIAWI